jgi:hypothetical protein
VKKFMTEHEFIELPPESKVEFINNLLVTGKKLDEIARNEFRMSGSWLSKQMIIAGYAHNGKRYVQKKADPKSNDEISELLQYKTILIELAKREESNLSVIEGELDLSVLGQFEEEEKNTKTFRLPATLNEKLDELVRETHFKYQDLLVLAVYRLLYKRNR